MTFEGRMRRTAGFLWIATGLLGLHFAAGVLPAACSALLVAGGFVFLTWPED